MALHIYLTFVTVLYTCYLTSTLGHDTQSFHLTILHSSDITGSLEQFNSVGESCDDEEDRIGECFGGLARHATVIHEVRSERIYDDNINVVLLDGGDHFVGEWFSVYKGEAISHFMNKLDYDAMTFGNLDFALGPNGLASFLNEASFDAVSANLNVSNEPVLQGLFQKSVVKSFHGEQVGIIGYTFEGTNDIAMVGNACFEDVVKSVQDEVNMLESVGVNKIIVLGHTYGFVQDGNEAINIARNVPGVDVIVLGGALLFQCNDCSQIAKDKAEIYRTAPYPMKVVSSHDHKDKVLLVNGYIDGRYIGRLNVVFDDEGRILKWDGNPIRLDNHIRQDPEMLTEIRRYTNNVVTALSDIIGTTSVKLQGAPRGEVTCRQRECNLGNLITDSMVWYYKTSANKEWNDVSMAVMNGGAIRASINKGDIQLSDLTAVLPFESTFDAIEIQGKYIREMLEHAAANYEHYSGAFLQVSGMKVTYNLAHSPYHRVVEVLVRCRVVTTPLPTYCPLENAHVYKMAVSSFMKSGGDGYEVLKDNVLDYIGGEPGRDVVASYIKDFSPVSSSLEERITLQQDNPSSKKQTSAIDVFVYVVVFVGIVALLGLVYKLYTSVKRRKRYSKQVGLLSVKTVGESNTL